MSNLEDIAADLRVLQTGVDRASTDTAGADHQTQEIINRAVAAGFGGIAQSMSRVRDAIGEIRAGLARADATIKEVNRPVTGAPTARYSERASSPPRPQRASPEGWADGDYPL